MNRIFSPNDAAFCEELLRARRDVRGHLFKDRPIEESTISRIIDAGLAGPSVGFSQPWRFVIVRDPDIKKQIKKSFEIENTQAVNMFTGERADEYRRLKLEGITEAPVNIAVYYVPSEEPVLGQTSMQNMGAYSVVCAIQNMWLMARALNIGMGWVSILDPEKVSEILHTPKDWQLIGYLCFGYVTEFQTKPELELKGWEKRKDKEGLIFFDSIDHSSQV